MEDQEELRRRVKDLEEMLAEARRLYEDEVTRRVSLEALVYYYETLRARSDVGRAAAPPAVVSPAGDSSTAATAAAATAAAAAVSIGAPYRAAPRAGSPAALRDGSG